MYCVRFFFSAELGLPNSDNICMYVVNNQFELLEFIFDSVYLDLQYNEIYLTFFCWVCVLVWCM